MFEENLSGKVPRLHGKLNDGAGEFPCVRPTPGRFPGAGRAGEGGCGDGWASGPGERAGGRAERARAARTFVGGYSARATPVRAWTLSASSGNADRPVRQSVLRQVVVI